MTAAAEPGRDWLVDLGLAFGALVAAGASFFTLAELARLAAWQHDLAYALPLSIDIVAVASARVWLSKRYPDTARTYARRLALGTIAASLIGNAIAHLVSAGYLVLVGGLGVALVIVVGAVPPAMLAAAAHLRTLLSEPVPSRRSRRSAEPVPSRPTVPVPVPATGLSSGPSPDTAVPVPVPVPARSRPAKPSGPGPSSEPVDELLLRKAQHLDEQHRAANDGRAITRNVLRAELGIGNAKAGEVLRALREGRAA